MFVVSRPTAARTVVRHYVHDSHPCVCGLQLNLERRAKLGAALRAPEEAPRSEIGGTSWHQPGNAPRRPGRS